MKKVVIIAEAKNASRACAPFGESSSLQKTVASIAPEKITALNRKPNDLGILVELINDLLASTPISTQDGLANSENLAFTVSISDKTGKFAVISSCRLLYCF